ncbi:Threonyl-tRNA synthetase [Phytophthora palmivora]|uniref:Threonyl-tRNA synthetase n=1 Tax=Phytophthora palmivora TaxID=4796 RepID=A0A2P4Y4V5_9STRA|nr:Threonyl-tRNA synthetase [Phytophthora palmivora]
MEAGICIRMKRQKAPIPKQAEGAIEILSESLHEEGYKPIITKAQKAAFPLMRMKPKEIPEIPQLLVLRQREREAISQAMKEHRKDNQGILVYELERKVSTQGSQDIEAN